MTPDQLRRTICRRLAGPLKDFPWRIEAMADDPYSLAIGIFNVPPEDEERVTRTILDLDWELCQNSLFGIAPVLRDPETTRVYYPQLASRVKAS